jgi:predicted small secreted protein
MRKLQTIVLLSSAVGILVSTSCAATKGLGQDLQKVGSRLEDRADATGGAEPVRSTGIYAPATTPVVPEAY